MAKTAPCKKFRRCTKKEHDTHDHVHQVVSPDMALQVKFLESLK